MIRRDCFVLAAIAAAGPSFGQHTTTNSVVTFSLHWSDRGGVTNGVLEPGEHALLWLDASFTGQNGPGTIEPSINLPPGPYTIRGFGSGFLDLHASPGSAGTWDVSQSHGYGVDPTWDITNGLGNGEPSTSGSGLSNLEFAQFAATPGAIITSNPVTRVWSGVWTPESYSGGAVSFTPAGAAAAGNSVASVVFQLNPVLVGMAFVVPQNLVFESVTIPVVPAPAVFGAIWLAPFARRPSRRPIS